MNVTKVLPIFHWWKVEKSYSFFTCILLNYVPHEIIKEFWKNSHFENMSAGFLLRCQNTLRWNTSLEILSNFVAFSEYIYELYHDIGTVVEFGVGNFPWMFDDIKSCNHLVLCLDSVIDNLTFLTANWKITVLWLANLPQALQWGNQMVTA